MRDFGTQAGDLSSDVPAGSGEIGVFGTDAPQPLEIMLNASINKAEAQP